MPHHRWKEAGILGNKEFFKFVDKLLRFADLAFPDYEYFPAFFSQFAEISFISGSIAITFCLPELFVCFWNDAAVFAAVHVPEAAVYKDYLSMFNKNQIRFAGQILSMK